ncbi:MAG: DUF1643 domain-containing protein [Oscillospiraceae bacterium]
MAAYKKYVKDVIFCGNKYKGIRYLLDIEFEDGDENKTALVIMQNPSKADEKDSDTTITAVLNRLHKFRYSRVYLSNLIPFYGTDSATIKELVINPCLNNVYIKNDDIISTIVNKVTKIFVAWGDKNTFSEDLYNNRIACIHKLLQDEKVYCSGLTNHNNPLHPSRGGWPKDLEESSFVLYQMA